MKTTYSAVCSTCGTAIIKNTDFDTAVSRKNNHNSAKHGAAYNGPADVVEDV